MLGVLKCGVGVMYCASASCGVHGDIRQLLYIAVVVKKRQFKLRWVSAYRQVSPEQKLIRSHTISYNVPGTYEKYMGVGVDIVTFCVLVLVAYTDHELAHISPIAQALKTCAGELSPIAQALKIYLQMSYRLL